MKQSLAAIFLFSTFFCVAQTEKGKYVVGGAADISVMNHSGITNFSMDISPSFGIFVVNNFTVGARYSFGIRTNKSFDKSKDEYVTTTTFTTAIGPKLSYYIGKKQLKGLVSANAGYTVYTQMRKGNLVNKNGFMAGGFLGMAYFFNPHVALETGVYTNASGYKGDFPTLRIGFSVGFSVLLDKKKKE